MVQRQIIKYILILFRATKKSKEEELPEAFHSWRKAVKDVRSLFKSKDDCQASASSLDGYVIQQVIAILNKRYLGLIRTPIFLV